MSEVTSPIMDAWAAGFYEGEGSVVVGCLTPPPSSPSAKPHVKARVAQVDRCPLERLKRWFGGCISQHRPVSNERQAQWVWEVSHVKADDFYARIMEYLSDRRQEQIRAAYARAGREFPASCA